MTRTGGTKRPEPSPGTVVVGDVHGDLAALQEVLRHAELIDPSGSWSGGRTTLVQVGDVIDRGPDSIGVLDYLKELQTEALPDGGDVVRLIGNHELELLMGRTVVSGLSMEETAALGARVRSGVADGTLVAACVVEGYLVTHAGLHLDVLRDGGLERSLRRAGGVPALADLLRKILCHAVDRETFFHPIFRVGHTRGGQHWSGGIFWEDAAHLSDSGGIPGLKQIFGHSPHERIFSSRDGLLTNVDVGLSSVYGGARGYLRIRDGQSRGVMFRERVKPAG